jgi:hypothetical protein
MVCRYIIQFPIRSMNFFFCFMIFLMHLGCVCVQHIIILCGTEPSYLLNSNNSGYIIDVHLKFKIIKTEPSTNKTNKRTKRSETFPGAFKTLISVNHYPLLHGIIQYNMWFVGFTLHGITQYNMYFFGSPHCKYMFEFQNNPTYHILVAWCSTPN